MKATYPLPLNHSWPLFDGDRRFDLGLVLDGEGPAAPIPDGNALACRGIGTWSCDLVDDSLAWSPAVHDLFGLPRTVDPRRAEAVALYEEGSRAAMERLRAHAITHRRGFTLDIAIRPGSGGDRWIRLTAMPVCKGRQVIRLWGYKQDVTHRYR